MRDPSGVSRGSGFVAFSTPEEASRAVSCSLVHFSVSHQMTRFCIPLSVAC